MSLFRGNKPKINIKCAYFKRKGVEEAICVKTKKKPQKQKTHIQKLQNRRTKIKNKKKFIEIKSERKCKKGKKRKRLHIRYEDLQPMNFRRRLTCNLS